jgi:predicted Rossmann fold flavoprotein
LSIVGIVGAGPAGILAALESSKKGNQTLLFDSNLGIGRKLLVTGAGRCNLTNAAVDAQHYTCADKEWMTVLLKTFNHEDLLAYLKEQGILTTSTLDGWFYPASYSAATVVDTLTSEVEKQKVDLVLNTRITTVDRSDSGFILSDTRKMKYHVDHLVLAFGGKASPDLGSTGELFPLLAQWGHTVIPLRPALAPIEAEMKNYKRLQGVRLDAHVRLFSGTSLLGETTGNLIFTEWGLNGPAVMDLSHLVYFRNEAELRLELDLLLDFEKDLHNLFERKSESTIPARVLLGSILPPKVPPVILAQAGLDADIQADRLTPENISGIFQLLKALPFHVTGVRGFKYCQVSAGGVPVTEVDPQTMRSLIFPGLFLAGEVLDVVGPCGGYNLQFAFSSGVAAGRAV